MRQLSRIYKFLLIAGGVGFLSSCSSLHLDGVDFAWPVESVQTVDKDNVVTDLRYAISFHVGPLATEEFGDSSALTGKTLRILRNSQGYYFATGPRFRSVYVFSPGKGSLSLHTRIEIHEESATDQQRLSNPALNQREAFIELVDGAFRMKLDSDGPVDEAEEGDSK